MVDNFSTRNSFSNQLNFNETEQLNAAEYKIIFVRKNKKKYLLAQVYPVSSIQYPPIRLNEFHGT